jgi:CheY-like chemotaxis protein
MRRNQSGTEAKADQPSPAVPKTILLVEDMDEIRSLIKFFLGTFGYVVHSFSCAEDALTLFNPHTHDMVVTDNVMPGMTGEEMSHIIKLRSPSTPVLMYTGHYPADSSCLDRVVQKPGSLPDLKDAIDQLLASRRSAPAQLAITR